MLALANPRNHTSSDKRIAMFRYDIVNRNTVTTVHEFYAENFHDAKSTIFIGSRKNNVERRYLIRVPRNSSLLIIRNSRDVRFLLTSCGTGKAPNGAVSPRRHTTVRHWESAVSVDRLG